MKLRQSPTYTYQLYDQESSTVRRKHNKYFSCGQETKKIKPQKKKQQFSHKENEKILKLVLTYGPKFKKIAKLVGNRSTSIVKNHYYKQLRYKWDQILGNSYIHYNCEQHPTKPLIRIEDVKEMFNQLNFDQNLRQQFTSILDSLDILDISHYI